MAGQLFTLYRISDGSNQAKNKLSHADKFHCLRNYLSVFGNENLLVFADNCSAPTLDELTKLGITYQTIKLGNRGSFLHIVKYAIEQLPKDDYVYLLEDDYLHLPGSRQALLEGLAIADYVSLYDHPDKYVEFSKGGLNHYVIDGGETTKIFLTQSSHWKETNSTTMTFAARIGTLAADYKIWAKWGVRDYYVWQDLLRNEAGFSEHMRVVRNKLSGKAAFRQKMENALRHFGYHFNRKRRLITPVPGMATHVELNYLSPLRDWQKV